MRKTLLLFVFFCPVLLFAQWTSTPKPANTIVKASGLQRDVKFSADKLGNTYYIWTDSRNNKTSLFVQKLDALGVPKWSEAGVEVGLLSSSFTNDVRFSPKTIRPDGKGGALIVWHYFPNPENVRSARLYIQHIAANGSTAWQGGKQVSNLSFYSQDENFEVVEIAPNGESIDVLYSYRSESQVNSYALYLKSVSAQTGETTSERELITNIKQPKGLIDEKNQEVVFYYQQGSIHELQRVSIAKDVSASLKTTLFVSDKPNRVDLFRFEDDYSVVMGRSETNGSIENVYAHKVARNGVSVWGSSGYKLGDDISFDLQLVPSEGGSTIATWVRKTQPSRSLRSVRFLENGTIVWEKNITEPSSNYFIPNKLVSDAENGAFTLWFSSGQNGGNNYTLQRIDKNGNLVFGGEGKVMEGWGSFTDYRLLGHQNGGCIAIFGSSATNGSIETFDIFTNRINNDGSYGIKNSLQITSELKSVGVGEKSSIKLTNTGDGFLDDNNFKIVLYDVGTKAELVEIGNGRTFEVQIEIPENIKAKTYLIKGISSSPESETQFTELNVMDKTPDSPKLSSIATTYCSGSDVTVNSTGCSGIVSWSDGSKGATLTFKISSAISITATCELNGKKSIESTPIDFVIVERPVATASNTGPYFQGETILLNAEGGSSYSWTGPNGFTNAEKSPKIQAATVQQSGKYEVNVSNTKNGVLCSSKASTDVVVNPILGIEPVSTILGVNIFPNPSSDAFSVEFTSKTNQKITIGFFNSLGLLVSETTINSSVGKQTAILPTKGVSSGVYIIRLSEQNQIVSKTVIVR